MRALLPAAAILLLAMPGSGAAAPPRPPHCDVEAGLPGAEGAGIRVRTVIRLERRPPSPLELELSRDMDVLSAECGGKAVPFVRRKDLLVLDLSGTEETGTFTLAVVAAGLPTEVLPPPEGSLLRSAVTGDLVLLRRECRWYPRLPGVAATSTLRVPLPPGAGWIVRASGEERSGAGEIAEWREERPAPGIELVARRGGVIVEEKGRARGSAPWVALVAPERRDAGAALLDLAVRARRQFEGIFGPDPFPARVLVEVPDAFGAASVLAGDSYVMVGSRILEAGPEDPGVAALLPHEIARVWWDRAVPFSDFSGRTLAAYATLRFIEENEGAEPAREERRQAVENLLRLSDRGRGGGLAGLPAEAGRGDAELRNALVFQKGMMLLVMAEDATGRAKWDAHLARTFAALRGRETAWADLRAALERAGPGAAAVLSQWDSAEIPALRYRAEKSPRDRRWVMKVRLEQDMTEKPFRMDVTVQVVTSGECPTSVARLGRGESGVALDVPSEPRGTLLDPDWRLLASRPPLRQERPLADRMKDAFEAVNRSDEGDRETCTDSLAAVRRILREGPGPHEALCHVAVGRLLFRLGDFPGARASFARALDAGSGRAFDFPRRWAWLRLGCMADVEGDRAKAREWYGKVIADGIDDFQSRKAKEWTDHPYRGYETDR